MWVVPKVGTAEFSTLGITPTYVGSTSSAALAPIFTMDHPHVCG